MPEFETPEIEESIGQPPSPEKPSLQTEREFTPEELREKMRDPHFLPTHKQIRTAFTTEAQWDTFCRDKENPVFEFLNDEYCNALADYFVEKIAEHGASKEKPLVILEIGAGNGRLSHFLQEKIKQRAHGEIVVVASDSGEWGLKNAFPVEQLSHKEAMATHRPDIVVFSWMPAGEDVSADIRECDSVQEYVLIGEADFGCCGRDWETWGREPLESVIDEDENEPMEGESEKKIPPYEADGFEKKNLHALSDWQVCRTDTPPRYFHSETVSFRRKTENR